ncbi:SigB/SigF/SigG family RNA polymerase sigma factor [Hamadaea sp.]|uniref:SigB/SigF/SigG family RNA polymerase sigma factor n=1 Tax=Hamadaea sp. TaxID=2024425 RepID=UPI0025B90D6A|nr:SigB/SigF/SigG family RNA polymerase sigma factor [Hamadaea sp.]
MEECLPAVDGLSRQELIHTHLPLARRLAARFRQRGEEMDDLTQVAVVGLITAANRFDPGLGRPFVAFAVPTIVGALRRHFRDHGWMLHVSRGPKEHYVAISAAFPDICQRLQHTPTAAEIGAQLHLSSAEVREAMQCASAYTVHSIDAPTQPGGGYLLREVLGHPDPAIEQMLDRQVLRQAVASLRPRDQEILRLRFIEHMTQRQIADRIGVNHMQISRRLSRILATLRGQFADG